MQERKESLRWLESYQRLCETQQHRWEQAFDTRLVYLADRQADLFEIYAEHRHLLGLGRQTADWLIRARHNRNPSIGEKRWAKLARSVSHDGRPGMPRTALQSAVFDDEEWKAVYIVSNKQPPDIPPVLNEIIRMIGGKDFTLAIESHRRALDFGSG